MNRLEQFYQRMTARLDEQRTHAHRLKERAELDGTRITAAEDALTELALRVEDLSADNNNTHSIIRTDRRLCDGRRDANANALGKIQTEIEAVLQAHTTSIFRLEAKLDRIAEQFAAAGFAPLTESHGKDAPDANNLDPEGDVDRTERIINTASTNTCVAIDPLRA